MDSPVTCVVTLHGIGFQQPPLLGIPGYADDLHENLSKFLDGTILSDDPNRQRSKPGENGPVYVQSCWPPGTYNREMGLARLGTWNGNDIRKIDASNAPLTNGDSRVAHVALVYSHLEEQGPQPGAAFIAGAMVTVSISHYAHIAGLVQMVLADSGSLFGHSTPATDSVSPPKSNTAKNCQRTPGLRIRSDPGFKSEKHLQNASPTGLLAILRQLENDVAAYVCRNEMRERIRSFVLEALMRLACRDDVSGIVINAHSNGTVIALDVVRQMPPFAAAKIKAFITAGSPLRKYIDLFRWGQQIDSINPIKPWINFWDPKDPVADPLSPPLLWHRGDAIQPSYDPGLFQLINPNTGTVSNIVVEDRKVDNMKYSPPGDLQAHNYWDNNKQFVKQLADILRQVVASDQLVTN